MSNTIQIVKQYSELINKIEKNSTESHIAIKSLEYFDDILKILLNTDEVDLYIIYNLFMEYKSNKYRRHLVYDKLRTSIKK